MAVYTPPIGMCTACEQYIGRPSTGKQGKRGVGHRETFDDHYVCPVCGEGTEWRRLLTSEMSDDEKRELARTHQFSEELAHRFSRYLPEDEEVDSWQPDYRE